MKSQRFKNFILLLVTVFVILVLFEAALRIFKPQIFEIHPKGMYIADPHVGYLLRPGFKGIIKREEFNQYFRVNNKALRGKYIGPKQKDSYRVLILGDSYTFGFGVKEKETFSALLQQCLAAKTPKKVDVINGGVPGYGTIDELNLLKLIGLDIKPDLIIVQFLSVTDFAENRDPAVECADVKDGYLTSKQRSGSSSDISNSFSFQNIIYWLKWHLHSARFISERLGYLAMRMGFTGGMNSFSGEDFSKEDEEKTMNAFHQINLYAKHLGADVILLYTVGQASVLSPEQNELRSEKFIRNMSESENFLLINSLRELRKRQDKKDLYFPIDGHLTSKGHIALSEIICDNLGKKFIRLYSAK